MTVTLLFLLVIAAIGGRWLSTQRLTAKPWLEEGVLGGFPDTDVPRQPAVKFGLGVFLAVAGCLFALLISAYITRVDLAASNVVDKAELPVPTLLWLNTGLLLFSSVTLHWASVAARRGQMGGVRIDLIAGAIATLLFVVGQLLAWQQLGRAGYFLASNPAASFFYLLTGTHGLHVLGGLVALGRTAAKAWRGAEIGQLRLSVELCAIYWHFLLLIWLVVFALIMGWADDLVSICRALVS
jgi:cytochrome c oxidase subunit 3